MVVVWDAWSGEAVQRILVWHCPHFLRVLDDSQLATGGWASGAAEKGDLAVIWSVASSSLRHELRRPGQRILLLEASPCGSKLVTVCQAGRSSVYIWDVATGRLQRELHTSSAAWAWQVVVSHGGADVALLAHQGLRWRREFGVWVSDGTTGELRQRVAGISSLLPGGRHGFSIDSQAAVWDVYSGAQMLALRSGIQMGNAVLSRSSRVPASFGGHVLAACGDLQGAEETLHHMLAIWDTRFGRVLFRTEHPSYRGDDSVVIRNAACDVAVSPVTTMANEFLD